MFVITRLRENIIHICRCRNALFEALDEHVAWILELHKHRSNFRISKNFLLQFYGKHCRQEDQLRGVNETAAIN